jgi:hypothetical protein
MAEPDGQDETAGIPEGLVPKSPSFLVDKRRQRESSRRAEALALRMAGLSYAQIGERLSITTEGAVDLVRRTLQRASVTERESVEEERALENARLDRVQAALWPQVLQGDHRAIDLYLRISASRRKMNGTDAPTKIQLSVNIREEMEFALNELEKVVLGQVVQGEVISSEDGPPY